VTAVLDGIVARSRERVEQRKNAFPLERLQASPEAATPRGFAKALARPAAVNVIAEFKRRSPSRGIIREDLEPADAARAYERGGAAALSVLTEEDHFGGSLQDLRAARAATALPALRKDFVVDPYQVWEARAAAADAVLLIVAALDDRTLATLLAAAKETGLDVLVEVHDRAELERALRHDVRMVGVNNRDLRTMAVRLETSLDLASAIPDDVVAVAESGLRTPEDLRRLRDAGFDAFLIGEHLMQAPDPGGALQALIQGVHLSAGGSP
jgi:indole-3-glycerol phosphate synthase